MIRNIVSTIVITGLFLSSMMAGSLTGRVNFDGSGPPKKKLKMDADPVCGAAHKTPAYRESFVMNDEGYMANVLVYLKDIKYDGGVPDSPAVLDQTGCQYIPHVQGMMAGQDLLIKNSDATLHNIHGLPKINSEFNFAMPKVVKEKTITFDKTEHPIYIKCDVHPWMKSYISVFDHPYFAVTDDTGSFRIDSIPAGTYEVAVWQEMDKKYEGFNQTDTIEIGDGETAKNFTLAKGEKKKK